MKIARARIRNFKQFDDFKLDLVDSLDRVRDLTVLVGPNGSGKTTILDAIACALGPATQFPTRRAGLAFNVRDIVRRGALYAQVDLSVRFTDEEIRTAQEVFRLAEEDWTVPDAHEVDLSWKYPSEEHKYGRITCEPPYAWTLFQARKKTAGLVSTGIVALDRFRQAGGCFTFDQQRTGVGKVIPRGIWQIIRGETVSADDEANTLRAHDPQDILLAMAVSSQVASTEHEEDQYRLVKEEFDQVCAPHRIVGVARSDLGDVELRFGDRRHEYGYGSLCSGEEMILLFLIRIVSERIHRSIVLVDELELHQHQVWQRRLLNALPKMGEGNQIIVTTHSAYLRDVAPPESVVELGEVAAERA